MPEPKQYTQEEIDKLIDDAKTATIGELTAEREKNRAMKAKLDEVETTLKKLSDDADAAKKAAERADLEKKGKFDELLKKHTDEYATALQKKDGEITTLREQLKRFRVDNAILAASENAISPDDVVTLLKARYDFMEKDGGNIEIVKLDGTPVLSSDGKPVDIKTLTTDFLAGAPHLVKPTSQGGAGTKGGNGSGERNPWKKETLNLTEQSIITKTDPARAARLKAEAGIT